MEGGIRATFVGEDSRGAMALAAVAREKNGARLRFQMVRFSMKGDDEVRSGVGSLGPEIKTAIAHPKRMAWHWPGFSFSMRCNRWLRNIAQCCFV